MTDKDISIGANMDFFKRGRGTCTLVNVHEGALVDCKQRRLHIRGSLEKGAHVHCVDRPTVSESIGENVTWYEYDTGGHFMSKRTLTPRAGENHSTVWGEQARRRRSVHSDPEGSSCVLS